MIIMKKREIYVVDAKTVDANGNYTTVSNYPQEFDSKYNNNDIEKTENKAYAAFDAAGSAGHTNAANGRPLTIVSIIRISDGKQLDKKRIGTLPDVPVEVPDPEPEPEPENPEGGDENGGES